MPARNPRRRPLALLLGLGLLLVMAGCADGSTGTAGVGGGATEPPAASSGVALPGGGSLPAGGAPGPGTPAGGTPAGGSSTAGAQSSACHGGDPLAGIYHPGRLEVRDACRTVSGTVDCVKHEADGDTHIRLRLDAADSGVLTDGNAAQRCSGSSGPHLVVEGIPQHCGAQAQRDASDNCADRGGFTSPPEPLPGDHISVTGPLVVDRASGHQGWAEIHPVEAISGGTPVGLGPAPSVLVADGIGGPAVPVALAARCDAGDPTAAGPDPGCARLEYLRAVDAQRLAADLGDETG